jgi:hypothetical protein
MRYGLTVLALAAVVALPRGVAKADDCTCADSPSVAEVCVVAPVSGVALPASVVDAISADVPLSIDAELVAPTLAADAAVMVAPAKAAGSSHTVLWCGGADGARCREAAKTVGVNRETLRRAVQAG